VARIRSVKPEFWTDGNMIGLSPWARLFYIGTWNFSLCDRGHLPDDAVGLKLKILPADDVDGHALLAELIVSGRLVRRRGPGGRTYLFNPRLGDHQKVDARWQSRCPHCAAEQGGGFVEEQANSPESAKPPASSGESSESVLIRAVTEPNPSMDRRVKGGDGIGEVPPTAGNSLSLVAAPTAQTLIAEWIEHCRKRPPQNVVGQVSKQIKALLGEGIDLADVRTGLAAWHQKGLHPSALPSVVNELMNATNGGARASPRPSTTDVRVAGAFALADHYREIDGS